MGEIKSTLDLVMERTKHLQLSDSERREQKTKESEARLRGMVQKLQDGILSETQFADQYRRLKSDGDLIDDAGLISECIGRLSINGDSRGVLAALKSASGSVDESVQAVIEAFRVRYHECYALREEGLKEQYAVQHGISGTAFTPNPGRDPDWRRETEALEQAFRRALAEAAAG